MSAGVWYTRREVAGLHDVDPDTVRSWGRRGRVEQRTVHGVVLVNAESVERYLRERGNVGQHTARRST